MNRAWWIIVVAGLLACSGRGPDSILLIDQPSEWQTTAEATLPTTGYDPITSLPHEYAGYVEMRTGTRDKDSRDVREALLTPEGVRGSYQLKVPSAEAVALQVSLGWAMEREPRSRGAGQSIGYSLVLEHQGESSQLLQERTETSPRAQWQPRRIDLSHWRGREVKLVFSGQSTPVAAAAWANPEVTAGSDAERETASNNLILISLDTLRADRLGVYGYQRETSPNLDRFTEPGLVFLDATAQSTWTRPSHRSMLTGLYPESREGFDSPPLAELLRAQGLRTEAWTGGVHLHPRFHFHRGFQRFQIRDWVAEPASLLQRLAELRRSRFFLFLHTYESHDPYDHPEQTTGTPSEESRVTDRFTKKMYDRMRSLSPAERQRVSDLYDADIRHLDRQLRLLFEGLSQLGLLETTTVVITSDHGEEFWDHDRWFHGHNFHPEMVRVPLILRVAPGPSTRLGIRQPGRIRQPARLVDLYATLSEILEVPLEHRTQGRSLVPLMRGETLPEVPIYTEGLFRTKERGRALRVGQYKLIWRFHPEVHNEPQITLFDVAQDPDERLDISWKHPDIVEQILTTMDAIAAGRVDVDSMDEEDLDPEHRERLRALGYL